MTHSTPPRLIQGITIALIATSAMTGCSPREPASQTEGLGVIVGIIKGIWPAIRFEIMREAVNTISGSGNPQAIEDRDRTWVVRDMAPGGWTGGDWRDLDTGSLSLREIDGSSMALRDVARQRRGIGVVVGDINGDRKADPVIVRSNEYHFLNAGTQTFGDAGDLPIIADFNRDNVAELGVYRRETSTFHSTSGYFRQFGNPGDMPYLGDFDGDGRLDIAVYRPSERAFHIDGLGRHTFGNPGDVPVSGDFDGDRKSDIAVYRPAEGRFYVKGRSQGPKVGPPFSWPIIADYNADGRSDFAVYHAATRTFYVHGVYDSGVAFGNPGDIPVPADYDGDGAADVAVYRTSTAEWHIYRKGSLRFGTEGDLPGQLLR